MGCLTYPCDSGSEDESRPVGIDSPDDHAHPSDGSALEYYHFKFVLLAPKPREMQSNDDLKPFLGLIASTVVRYNSKDKSYLRIILG